MDQKTITGSILELAKEIVAIPSHNKERDLVNFLLTKYDSLGLRAEAVGGDLEHPSLLCFVSNSNYSPLKSKTILLEAALDTTSPGDFSKWKNNPYIATQEGNKLEGLGIADSKIAISMFTHLAKALSEDDEFDGQIIVGFDSQEQNGRFLGIREIIPYLPKIDGCFLGYQSFKEIHIGARGWVRLSLTTFGKSGHTGSRYSRGINAIDYLIQALIRIKQIDLSHSSEYFEFGSKMTISTIKGGIAENIVPDKAVASLDIRLVKNQHPNDVVAKIQNCLYLYSQEDPNFDYKIEINQAEKAYLTDPDNQMLKILIDEVTHHCLFEPSIVASGPGSVGNVLAQLDFPIINAFGVDSGGAHSTTEWINTDTVEPVFKTLYSTIKKFCSLKQ